MPIHPKNLLDNYQSGNRLTLWFCHISIQFKAVLRLQFDPLAHLTLPFLPGNRASRLGADTRSRCATLWTLLLRNRMKSWRSRNTGIVSRPITGPGDQSSPVVFSQLYVQGVKSGRLV